MSTPLESLTTAIKAEVEALVVPVTRKELSNHRDPTAVAQDDLRMLAFARQGAAKVQAYLGGDVDGEDQIAVTYGAEIALAMMQGTWNAALGDKSVTQGMRIVQELDRERRRRVVAIDMETFDLEGENLSAHLDRQFPHRLRDTD